MAVKPINGMPMLLHPFIVLLDLELVLKWVKGMVTTHLPIKVMAHIHRVYMPTCKLLVVF